MRRFISLVVLALPAVVRAQGAAHTISPGMSRAQVEASLGAPITMRSAKEYNYLFYHNECARACGINDVVILRRDSVVDAIFRSASRHYTGKSSSPARVSRREAAHREAPKAMTKPRAKAPEPKGIDPQHRMPTSGPVGPPISAPREANDIRPSIPSGPPVRPNSSVTPKPNQ